MVHVDIEYQGDLRCLVTHGPSGMEITTDAPVDNQGKGEAFSPTDLVATALGTCMATVMGIVARREGIDLTGLRIGVDKEMVSSPRRRIGRLVTRIEMPAGLTDDQKTKLEEIASHCPVHQSLNPDIETVIEFVYQEQAV